jgi:hypothetical protein
MPVARNAEWQGQGRVYYRHQPEHTLLYQIVEHYYPAFSAYLAAQGRDLPRYEVKKGVRFIV